MIKYNLISKINIFSDSNVIGRIGGNIPEFFLDKLDEVQGYQFYLTFQNPDIGHEYITILTSEGYDDMIDNNIYPNCSVKVFTHTFSDESNNEEFTIKYINKAVIVGYDKVEGEEFDFITKTEEARLIQSEDYYFDALQKDGYKFFMQVDEDYYPDTLLDGDYIFGYGALYLYKNISSGKIIAGFWQCS
ncbi:hypothetical protein [Enterobacter sp. C6]|uniref:hypothetical protein n=1 Tax=Enterobacter sp. C6 TaxID=1299469 RepID=UPI0011E6DA9A|nr:hypothetical protein [Enterobacter sp. C6]KAE8275034.1 hypothetical protein DOU50_09605 [Enterobacter sp. C6]